MFSSKPLKSPNSTILIEPPFCYKVVSIVLPFTFLCAVSVPDVEIILSPDNPNFFSGLRLNLTCRVTADVIRGVSFVLQVELQRNGSSLPAGVQVIVNDTIENGVYERIFIFEALELADIGEYSCNGSQTVMEGNFNGTTFAIANQSIFIESRKCCVVKLRS